jgi:hypothetical protein
MLLTTTAQTEPHPSVISYGEVRPGCDVPLLHMDVRNTAKSSRPANALIAASKEKCQFASTIGMS